MCAVGHYILITLCAAVCFRVTLNKIGDSSKKNTKLLFFFRLMKLMNNNIVKFLDLSAAIMCLTKIIHIYVVYLLIYH